MIRIAKTIGRLIAVLVDAGIIERRQAVWILEPLKDKAETEGEEMYNDKVVEMVKDIVDKAEKGEKTGNIECPYCGGTVNYAYENGMAMRAKCLQCGFFLMA